MSQSPDADFAKHARSQNEADETALALIDSLERKRSELISARRSSSGRSRRSTCCWSPRLCQGHALVDRRSRTRQTLLARCLAHALGLDTRHPVHAGHDAGRHPRYGGHPDRSGHRRPVDALHSRADLHKHPAGRRDQPHAAQDAGGAARSHGPGCPSPARPARSSARSLCSRRRTPSSRTGPTAARSASTGSCSAWSWSTRRPPRSS